MGHSPSVSHAVEQVFWSPNLNTDVFAASLVMSPKPSRFETLCAIIGERVLEPNTGVFVYSALAVSIII